MDYKPLLYKTKKIEIILDSNSFVNLLASKNLLADAILLLRHREHEKYVNFVRTPMDISNSGLNEIKPYIIKRDETNGKLLIQIQDNKHEIFLETVLSIARNIYKKDIFFEEDISKEGFLKILNICVQSRRIADASAYASLSKLNQTFLYITNDELIWQNLSVINKLFYQQLNIISIEETSIILDTFLKKNGTLYGGLHIGDLIWYQLSTYSKFPHYNRDGRYMIAFFTKFRFALKALDELTFNYYCGVDYPFDYTMYHFNYFLSLITGMLDNLALQSDMKLKIAHHPLLEISLCKDRGKKFLPKIGEKKNELKQHIDSNSDYIRLLNTLRHTVIHRDEFPRVSFHNITEGWEAKLIQVDFDIISHCQDKFTKNENKFCPFSDWGFYQTKFKDERKLYIEPYHFSIRTINWLVNFSDKYMELLGYPCFVTEPDLLKRMDFYDLLDYFQKSHLGY